MAAERIPERNEIPVEFTWDLTDIFKSDEDWLREYEALMQVPEQLAEYEGNARRERREAAGVYAAGRRGLRAP